MIYLISINNFKTTKQKKYLLVNKMTGRQRNYTPCNYYGDATKLYTCNY